MINSTNKQTNKQTNKHRSTPTFLSARLPNILHIQNDNQLCFLKVTCKYASMLFLETHNEFIKIQQQKIGVNGLLGLSQIRCIEHKIGKQKLRLLVYRGAGFIASRLT